jgi:hypothetical protein
MWEPRPLTPQWALTACYRDDFTLLTLPTYLSVYPSIYFSTYLSIHPSIHPFIYLPIYLSIYPSIYLFIYLSIYLCFYGPLLGLDRFSNFLIFYTVGRTPSKGGSARNKDATCTQDNTHRINAHKHPCLKWASNPRCLRE